ncbi:MAG: nucleotidyltransferase family protein [Gemmatimonadetes bacterium]|nr:nucleotidyltransferase family protein [Gemmatimonadota bacterium]
MTTVGAIDENRRDENRRSGHARAIVLAAGRGTRMRAGAAGVNLDADQADAADRGLKGLIPFTGQPFLAYVLSSLADAGYKDVCLVTGPSADPVREHFQRLKTTRLRLHFAVQHEPLGSAHALMAAEDFSGDHHATVINSDNIYPVAALRALREMEGSGLIGFRRDGLLEGNIDADRIAGYAVIETDENGTLAGITEKPGATAAEEMSGDALVSMTCWRFGPAIYTAIRATPRSERGEYEIPDAVTIAMRDERFLVVPMTAPVLDLSRREDIPRVAARLEGRRVAL